MESKDDLNNNVSTASKPTQSGPLLTSAAYPALSGPLNLADWWIDSKDNLENILSTASIQAQFGALEVANQWVDSESDPDMHVSPQAASAVLDLAENWENSDDESVGSEYGPQHFSFLRDHMFE